MSPSDARRSPSGLACKAAAIAAVAAVVRFFVKGWLAPLGVPTGIGSFLASVTVVLAVAMVILFLREGRDAAGCRPRRRKTHTSGAGHVFGSCGCGENLPPVDPARHLTRVGRRAGAPTRGLHSDQSRPQQKR